MRIEDNKKKVGLLLGGSGLIGGSLTHYFKTHVDQDIEVLAPNSKKLSLRVAQDIKQYLTKIKPDFIINAAIASIDSGPLIAMETNYIATVNLAKAAIKLNIPYIHISSAATMPHGDNLDEDQLLELQPTMSNYPKSKLMAELTLKHLGESEGLDYTVIRLAVVYGKHDHKIQGFHRLFLSVADHAVPFMMTQKGVKHSSSNTKKLPPFILHVLNNRDEFSGQTYNFVDPEPVELAQIILTIKSYLQLNLPKEIYIPYSIAITAKTWLKWLMRKLSIISIEARMPAELIFLENFYHSQTLSSAKIAASSYGLVDKDTTVFTELPHMIEYYLTRWEHLNLIETYNESFYLPKTQTNAFINDPQNILDLVKANRSEIITDFSDLNGS
nr:NAD(P)-dependent oxidoreductase [Desulfobulbaceae bacterium]